MPRRFRFGLQVMGGSAAELRTTAAAAEAAGFDVLSTFDHAGDHWAPLAPLLAAALWTERLRICPLVLNNDFHHPVHLARELASMDLLTAGRLEVGIGAGHAFTEYAAVGQRFDPPAVRKSRLAEAVEVLRPLLDGETVTYEGEHYQLQGVKIQRAQQARVPILVAVNGRRALTHAAQHADAIGLTMLGRTLADGQRHEVRWQRDRLDRTVEHVRSSAGDRRDGLELHALVQAVRITDDRGRAAAELAAQVDGLSADDALTTPFILLGTHDEMAAHLLHCRERWGITSYTVRDLAAFAPVIERLRNGG
ncbi:MAG: TIGR03621 family F420-dependent LLM class oxidoreductase [Candidatus Dormiibacterota bacterium]